MRQTVDSFNTEKENFPKISAPSIMFKHSSATCLVKNP